MEQPPPKKRKKRKVTGNLWAPFLVSKISFRNSLGKGYCIRVKRRGWIDDFGRYITVLTPSLEEDNRNGFSGEITWLHEYFYSDGVDAKRHPTRLLYNKANV